MIFITIWKTFLTFMRSFIKYRNNLFLRHKKFVVRFFPHS